MPLSPARSSRALSALIPMLVLGLGLLGCGDNSTPAMPQVPPMTTTPTPTTPTPPPEPEPEPTTPDQPAEVTYDIQYNALISSNAFLQALGAAPYPEGVESAASLVLAEHPRDIVVWEEGGMASPGLKMLAETGDAAMLIEESTARGVTVRWQTSDAVLQLISVTQEITLNYENPCVTYAQGIVPSPDWFVGFTVCAVDEDGMWMEEVPLTAVAWDAGTDDGDDYLADDMASDPQMPISQLDKAPFSPAGTPVSVITATMRQES